ncbi:MAG: TIGR03619 family F420-dependent LLM class oxidoreductase [Gammaproteobacteria bacterium]|nr:TIGR03619 family F420-dependent LLM class oxidoreductase [Gammaproteobacteria bacterium]
MQLGLNLRNWGPHATPENLRRCAEIADRSAITTIWVNDHLGLPLNEWDNAYGISLEMASILDPLGVLSYVAAVTSRVNLGIAVLVIPYRPPLPTAKWLATIQTLSEGRLWLGAGPGYLKEEFNALGVDRSRRGRLTDEALALIHHAFADGKVEIHGQPLSFAPTPPRPPILIGGAPAFAFPRVIAHGDGWMPVGLLPDQLAPAVTELHARGLDAGRPQPRVIAMKTLPLEDRRAAVELARAYRAVGVSQLVHTQGYSTPEEYAAIVHTLDEFVIPAVAGE